MKEAGSGKGNKKIVISLILTIVLMAGAVLGVGAVSGRSFDPQPVELVAESNIFGEIELSGGDIIGPETMPVVRIEEDGQGSFVSMDEVDGDVKEDTGYEYKIYDVAAYGQTEVTAQKATPKIKTKANANTVSIKTKKKEGVDGYLIKENGKLKEELEPGQTFRTKLSKGEEKQYTVVAYQVTENEDGEEKRTFSKARKTRTFVAGYDPGPAVDYAEKYALEYNEEEFGNYNPMGGDCANFVSQCIMAGGYEEDGTWYKHSLAWLNVEAMYEYFKDKKVMIEDPSYEDFEKGDLIISNDYEELGHVVICTGTGEDGVPVFCGHNNDHLNDPVSIYSDMILIKMCEDI